MQLRSEDVTDRTLDQLGEVTSKGGLIVRFGFQRIDASGRTVDRLYVELQPRGDRSTVSRRYITDEDARKNFPVEYARFTEEQGVATNGTPLTEIPGMTNSQIGRLTIHGLTCVEELLKTETTRLQQIGRDALRAHELAGDWLRGRDLAADSIAKADRAAEAIEQAANLKAELDALKKQNLEMGMQIEAFEKISGNKAGANTTPAQERGNIQPDEPDEYGDGSDDDTLFETGASVVGMSDTSDPDPLASG